jgi:hypothetical protein
MKRSFVYAICICSWLFFSSWGFFAHMQINQLAVYTLPQGLSGFFKRNIKYITNHAVDPDKRRYADSLEAPRHYLDAEVYEPNIDSIPFKYEDALKKYGKKKLQESGTLPWQIQSSYYKLVNAFKARDSIKILLYAAYLGHYIGDAHVPLHTTENHNGQLTGQVGIHAFWESRIPELFAKDYNYFVGRATYMEHPLDEAWKIIRHTHTLVDTTLKMESDLQKAFPPFRRYSYSKRKGQVLKQYAKAYAMAYSSKLDNMVEKQMRASIKSIGNFWFSAWVDAGQPTMENLIKVPDSELEQAREERLNNKYEGGKIIGREN